MALQAGQFVTRNGQDLYDPTTKTPLRFASFNTPELAYLDDPDRLVPLLYEQEDLLRSVSDFGGRVVRTYVLSVQTKGDGVYDNGGNSPPTKHIIKRRNNSTAPAGQVFDLNEPLMRGLDNALAAAGRMGIRIIFPFIDQWEWWGGCKQFVQLVDPALEQTAFFTEHRVVDQFKLLIQAVLNRNNTVNGLLYRDDPALLAWETGNELEYNKGRVPTAWTKDIAAHIKSIDKNHLVMDGSWQFGWDATVLDDPNIDMYSNHYYPGFMRTTTKTPQIGGIIALAGVMILGFLLLILVSCFSHRFRFLKKPTMYEHVYMESKARKRITMAAALVIIGGSIGGIAVLNRNNNQQSLYGDLAAEDAAIVASHNKVYIAGEFGLAPSAAMQSMLTTAVDQPSKGFAGALVWSLRGHSRNGGFYIHSESGEGYFSYHYPGFPSTGPGFPADDISTIKLVKQAARDMAAKTGYTIPAPTVPIPPSIIASVSTTQDLRFMGSATASSYEIQRADGANAPATANWQPVKTDFLDNITQNSTMFKDTTAKAGTTYSYRVRAKNDVGVSEFSNVVSLVG
ncbi:glycoside hydrolase superfamily [Fimicolochytrium jonesii]|uniref:glycoside hydrolase superfamily n=1 Tax=Fimicolochytrium jonesii TaxID=1396493 RepID=UPI0022FE89F3|nr:glycoside hydrolase superfamily [Fimicolochytrium jonesii]KAI8826154.1 glycoside hydrolase superfamily [Fimicolochytrium jonesii]